MFERTVEVYLPSSSHSKLSGLCKTRWVERHSCIEVLHEMYETLVTFLDAIVSPHEYPDLASQDGSWNWDRDTKVKEQGLKTSLSSFQNITVFIITKNVLDHDAVKSIAAKLQKREQDVYDAYKMVSSVIENIPTTRENISTIFSSWYSEVLTLAEKVGVIESVPRKTSLQRSRTNVPSDTPKEHYQRAITIQLLDSLLSQMKERFSEEHCHALKLLFLIPSSICLSSNSGVEKTDEAMESLLYWERDLPFPSSLQNELRRWQILWQNTSQQILQTEVEQIPNTFLLALSSCDIDSFPNIHQLVVIACTLPITSSEAERSFSLLRRIKTCMRSAMAEEGIHNHA